MHHYWLLIQIIFLLVVTIKWCSPKVSIDPFNGYFSLFYGRQYKKQKTDIYTGNTLPNMKYYTSINIRSLGMIMFKLAILLYELFSLYIYLSLNYFFNYTSCLITFLLTSLNSSIHFWELACDAWVRNDTNQLNKNHETMLLTSGMCTNFKDNHDIKQ